MKWRRGQERLDAGLALGTVLEPRHHFCPLWPVIHETSHPPITTTICACLRSSTPTRRRHDMGNSFSKLMKDLKHRLRGKKHKPDRTGANAPAESVDSSGLFLRPEPRVVAGGGHDREQSGTSTVGQQVGSKDRSPQPEPLPAGGSDDDGKRETTGGDGREVSQIYSHPDSDVGVAVESGPSPVEVEQVHPAPSVPSIPPSGEPNST